MKILNRKNVGILLFSINILLIALVPPASADMGDTFLQFDCEVGDEFHYILETDIDIGLRNTSLYDEFESESLNISFADFVADVMDVPDVSMNLSIEVMDKLSETEIVNTTWYDDTNNSTVNGTMETIVDRIYANVSCTNQNMSTPTDYFESKIDSFADILTEYELLNETEADDLDDNMTSLLSEFVPSNWSNFALQSFAYENKYFKDNHTESNYTGDNPLVYNPLNISSMDGIPFFLPMEFNFTEMNEFMVDFMISAANHTGFDNLSVFMDHYGIQMPRLEEHGMSLIYKYEDMVNQTEFDELMPSNDVMINSINVSSDLQYSENNTLETAVFIFNGAFNVNMSELNPDIYNGTVIVDVDVYFSLAQDGFIVPNENDIEQGDDDETEESFWYSTRFRIIGGICAVIIAASLGGLIYYSAKNQ